MSEFLRTTVEFYEGLEKRVLNTERARIGSDTQAGLEHNKNYFNSLVKNRDIDNTPEVAELIKRLNAIDLGDIANRRRALLAARKMEEKQNKPSLAYKR